jgi:type VI secretion system secreted protein VgrG
VQHRGQRGHRTARSGCPRTDAIVVGDNGDGAIETDAYGRVKVQFHWDRIGRKNLQSSCWVRVASPVAGSGFGFIAVPRVGHEVVVAFLEGDPDRPIIVGSVYNAIDLVPYALPAHATVSTFKSRSRQAGADAFNELRFEDEPGREYLLLQAQKDRLEIVEDTLRSTIGNAEHRQVGSERRERIGSEWHVGVGADVRHSCGGKLSVAAKGAMMLETEAGYSLKAAADFAVEAGATISMQAAGDGHLKLGGHLGVASGGNVHLKGAVNIVVEAGTQLTLKAGPSFVVIGPDGVSITGPLVKINSGGAPGAGAGANPVAPTPPDEPLEPDPPKDPLAHR